MHFLVEIPIELQIRWVVTPGVGIASDNCTLVEGLAVLGFLLGISTSPVIRPIRAVCGGADCDDAAYINRDVVTVRLVNRAV